MSIIKRYLKSKPVCIVTFNIPKRMANNAAKVSLVGEFNNWNSQTHVMKKLKKNGAFTLTLELDINREYQFRYLFDDEKWVNEPEADKSVPTPFGDSENSVVIV